MLTDNGSCYRAKDFATELAKDAIAHTFTRPYRPQTNGKVERYNRTLLNEWAYARAYRSEAARTRALARWLHMYNHHRTLGRRARLHFRSPKTLWALCGHA